MPDFNKGDFTQQGVAGDVSALVRLNEKRVMKVVLSTDDESDNCDISGKVYDLLNGNSYDLGGTTPTGTINITENGDYDVSSYALRTVSVQGLDLIFTDNIGTVNTTNTTNTMIKAFSIPLEQIENYDIIVFDIKGENSTGKFIENLQTGFLAGTSNYQEKNQAYSSSACLMLYNDNNTIKSYPIGTSYGVFVKNLAVTTTSFTGEWTARYNASYGEINADFTGYVYGLKLVEVI